MKSKGAYQSAADLLPTAPNKWAQSEIVKALMRNFIELLVLSTKILPDSPPPLDVGQEARWIHCQGLVVLGLLLSFQILVLLRLEARKALGFSDRAILILNHNCNEQAGQAGGLSSQPQVPHV